MTTDQMKTKARRRLFQYSVRTLMVLILIRAVLSVA